MDDGSLVSHEHALPGSCQHSSDTFLLCGADGGGALGAQLGQAAAEFGFGAVSVAAGASYLRRLAAADAEVRALAGACPGYARLFAPAASLPGAALWLTPPAVPARPPHATVACVPLADWLGGAPRALPDGRRWLAALALTCVLLAAKNLEAVPFRGLHAAMLTVVCGAAIAPAAAADLELRVLAALGWRLGPFHHAP